MKFAVQTTILYLRLSKQLGLSHDQDVAVKGSTWPPLILI